MTPWWSEQAAALIGGVGGGLLGTVGGIFGAAVGMLAPRGHGRRVVMATHAALIAIGVAALVAGVAALALGQPRHVWYPLLLIGVIMTAVMGPLFPVMKRAYRAAELRKMEAATLRRS